MSFQTYRLNGTLKFPKFKRPESFNNETGKFIEDWEEGSFGTQLLMSVKEASSASMDIIQFEKEERQKLIDSVKKGDKYKGMKDTDILPSSMPYQEEKGESGNLTGQIEFRLKRKLKNKKGEKKEITFVDTKKVALDKDEIAAIGSGSEVNIIYVPYAWDKKTKNPQTKEEFIEFGISLCILGVQVVKMVSNNSIADEFEEVEGYVKNGELIGEDEIPF